MLPLLLATALASPTVLVGVDTLPWTAPSGTVDACFASSRVCTVRGTTPAALQDAPGVRHAEWDRPMQLQGGTIQTPVVGASAQCPDPHELVSTDVQTAWNLHSWGIDAPVIAVQDAGFRTSHVDLLGRISGGYDYGDDDPLPEVSALAWAPGHGTFIAGILAANDDGLGRLGMAPGAELFVQKVADSSGALYFSYAIAAMDDLATAHPEVGLLNYSIAATNPPVAFDDAVQALGDADILLVAAASNCPYPNCSDADNDQFPIFPSSYPYEHVVSVASLRPDGSLDPYSHFGATSVALAAPGADICSLGVASDTDYVVASGTSYATPVVAGTAALIREAFPRLTAAEVADALCFGAAPTGATAGKVACGSLRAPEALTFPAVDVVDSPDVAVDGRSTWTLSLDSRGAHHDAVFTLALPPGVDATPPATVAVPANIGFDIEVDLVATQPSSGTATWSLTLSDGTVLSESFQVDAGPGATADTGSFPTADTGPAVLTADTADTHVTGRTGHTGHTGTYVTEVGGPTTPVELPSPDCRCQQGGAAGGMWIALSGVIVARRRRTRR